MKTYRPLFLCILLLPISVIAQQLQLGAPFSNNMVLQQKTSNPVWGWDKPGTDITITVSWNGQSYEATTGADGRWTIPVETPEAGGPYTVAIKSSQAIVLENVMIGEVWLASGQSNMSMPLKGYYCQPVRGSNEAILGSTHRTIHFINVPPLAAYRPLEQIKAGWVAASPGTAGECSAVAWFFAASLQEQLGNVPVGIINASFGGSNVEAWMPPSACRQFTDIQVPPASDDTSSWINNVPTVLYNGMIHPLVGYTIKGMIWYQGESNIFNVPRYAPSVAAMVSTWRQEWNLGNFPFYFAQIAPYDYTQWNFFTPQWPEISAYQREAQLQSQKIIPNSAMAVLLDIGEEYQIHPPQKREVGERLAFLALAKTYGCMGFEYESPEYDSLEIKEDRAILYFSKQYNGLTSYEKPLELFEIAGENKVFVKANAIIDGEKGTVVVSSHLVNEPKAVRYAFRNYVRAELFGVGGLPVSSFRTDTW
ncbi:MAG: sialate O-acetylesterase [Bacteroidales bacterium]|nr:sialate O-acetylesterase [Lentimicrobiaceae bacterium]MDD5695020.1 sialate O-acetylesterase [Bacteroidales bacterium]